MIEIFNEDIFAFGGIRQPQVRRGSWIMGFGESFLVPKLAGGTTAEENAEQGQRNRE